MSYQHFLYYFSIPVPIKTPPNIFRLTTPPKTASTAQWEEASFLSDSAIDSWADREPMSPLEPLDVDMNTFFTSEYIEVLEPVEWGKNKGLFQNLSALLPKKIREQKQERKHSFTVTCGNSEVEFHLKKFKNPILVLKSVISS